MNEYPPRAGSALLVSTLDGEEPDRVLRVLETSARHGICIVDTERHGRVIVVRGAQNGVLADR